MQQRLLIICESTSADDKKDKEKTIFSYFPYTELCNSDENLRKMK